MAAMTEKCPRDGIRHNYTVRSGEMLHTRWGFGVHRCAGCNSTLESDYVEGDLGYPCCSAYCALQVDLYGRGAMVPK